MRRVWSSGVIIPQFFNQRRSYIDKSDYYLFLCAINSHNFSIANQIFSFGQDALKKKQNSKNTASKAYSNLDLHDDCFEFFSAHGLSSEYGNGETDAIRDAAQQSASVLKNVPLCLTLLKRLDSQVAEYARAANWNLTDITPGNLIQFTDHYALPAKPAQSIQFIEDAKHLHLFLINQQFKKYDINTQKQQYRFFGFVDRSHANAIIRSGALFSEEVAMGSLLVHGADTHYFQWYMLSMAVEMGWMRFKNNLKLRDFLTASVDFRSEITGLSLWDTLIDFSPHAYEPVQSHAHFGLRSPFYLTEWLLSNPAIPNLRGLMLMQWYANIKRIQSLYSFKFNTKPIPYPLLVGAHASSANNAAGISYFTRNDLFSFAPAMKKESVAIDMPGVYYEDTDIAFEKIKKIQRQVLLAEKKSDKKLNSKNQIQFFDERRKNEIAVSGKCDSSFLKCP